MATTVEMPPGYQGPTTYVDTEVRFGEDVLVPRFQERLETYVDKAPLPQDRSRCLELITSLELAKTLSGARPHTAMAALANRPDVKDPYLTSYTHHYPPKYGPSAAADRPRTATTPYRYHYDSTAPMGMSTYTEMHGAQRPQPRPPSPIRSGTASNTRSHKPHPPQTFMVWKFPSNKALDEACVPQDARLTNEKLNQITKRMFRSTYQHDYLGIPQGFMINEAFGEGPVDAYWKERLAYNTDSTQRRSYLRPSVQPSVLRVPTNRYGSNKDRARGPAVGTSPTINKVLLDLKTRTTYDRHFNDLAPTNVQQVRDVGRQQYEEAMMRLAQPTHMPPVKGGNPKEKRLGGGRQTVFAVLPPPDSSRLPDHISDWPGPL